MEAAQGHPPRKMPRDRERVPRAGFRPRGRRPSAGQPAPLRGRPLPWAWQADDPDLPPDHRAMPPAQWPHTGCPGERLGRGSSRTPRPAGIPRGEAQAQKRGAGQEGRGHRAAGEPAAVNLRVMPLAPWPLKNGDPQTHGLLAAPWLGTTPPHPPP